MKIFVTGASGFIGSALIPALLKKNYDVFVLVRSIEKIKKYDWYNNVKYIVKDLKSISKNDLEQINPDIVYHLAWSNLPNYQDPVHIKKNLPEQLSFLRAFAQSGLKKIIISGSCLEYGLKEGLLNEDDSLKPTTSYGLSKVSIYSMLKDLKLKYNFDFIWYRIFYVYGCNQNPKSLYPSLLRAIKNKDRIFKMSHGNQVRDFIHINDVINYFLMPLKTDMNGVFNISSGEGVRVKDFVRKIIDSYNSDLKIDFGYYEVPDYEPLNFWGNTRKFKELC